MSMSEQTLRAILNILRNSYDEVSIKAIVSERVMVKLWNSEPSVAQTWLTTSLELRLAKNRRIQVLEFSSTDPQQILKNIENLRTLADRVEESELYTKLPEPTKITPLPNMFDKRIVEAMQDLSKPVEAMLNGVAKHKVDRVAGTLLLAKERKILLSTNGFEGDETKTWIEAYLRAFKGEFSGHWAHGSTRLDLAELERVGEKASYYANITDRKADFTPGRYSVVLSPLVVGNLVNYVSFMASALYVMLGYSMFLKYKVGEKLGSDHVSVYDRPRDPSLPHATAFDDEGVETKDKAIIERGIVSSLLHNSATASKMGSPLTGNAGWLVPRAWNLEVADGDLKEEELAESIRNGIIITNNWYTRLQNYVEGQFSTVSRDATLLVKNGEIVGHVGRIRISETFPNLLSKITGATRERYDVHWWEVRVPTRAPYYVAENVMLTRPEI